MLGLLITNLIKLPASWVYLQLNFIIFLSLIVSRKVIVFCLFFPPVPSAAAQDTWSWGQYLKEQKAIAAPVELFSQVKY